MGVKGLLPCLRSISRPAPLDQYRGLTVAVDAMAWLHKGVFACDVRSLAKYQWRERMNFEERGVEPSLGNDELDRQNCNRGAVKRLNFDQPAAKSKDRLRNRPTRGGSNQEESTLEALSSKCVSYVMRHAEILRRDYNMEVVLVIDGAALPVKKNIDLQRRAERLDAFRQALVAEAGKDSRAARRLFARSCSVTHEMRHELVKCCRRSGLSFIVAPYEADAQMARLAHSGAVDLIITEDSDLLAYGCPRVLFKVDFDTRRGEEIQLLRDLAMNDDPSFRNWTHDMFVFMCIVAGCDYCKGIDGIGIKSAHKLVRMHRSPSKIFAALRTAGKMPEGYEDSFVEAYRTFRHQRVYCPEKERLDMLHSLEQRGLDDGTRNEMWSFLGPWVEANIAQGVANGIIHPVQRVRWDRWKAAMKAGKSSCHSVSSGLRPTSSPTTSGNCKTERSLNGVRYRPEREAVEGQRCSKKIAVGGKENELFSFFSKTNSKGDYRNGDCGPRPPLQEVYISSNANDACVSSSYGVEDSLGGTIHSNVSQPIPIHFEEYKSLLVGNTFQTLSRVRKGDKRSRRDVSKAMQRIRSESVQSNLPVGENLMKVTTSRAGYNSNPSTKSHPSNIPRQFDPVRVSASGGSNGGSYRGAFTSHNDTPPSKPVESIVNADVLEDGLCFESGGRNECRHRIDASHPSDSIASADSFQYENTKQGLPILDGDVLSESEGVERYTEGASVDAYEHQRGEPQIRPIVSAVCEDFGDPLMHSMQHRFDVDEGGGGMDPTYTCHSGILEGTMTTHRAANAYLLYPPQERYLFDLEQPNGDCESTSEVGRKQTNASYNTSTWECADDAAAMVDDIANQGLDCFETMNVQTEEISRWDTTSFRWDTTSSEGIKDFGAACFDSERHAIRCQADDNGGFGEEEVSCFSSVRRTSGKGRTQYFDRIGPEDEENATGCSFDYFDCSGETQQPSLGHECHNGDIPPMTEGSSDLLPAINEFLQL